LTLKAATADQIQRLSAPYLTYRHTTEKTAAVRKEARTASRRGAPNDLRRYGLSLVGGRTRKGEEGTWKNPGVGCAWADIVLTAPEVRLPLLFTEADNCTEDASVIALKFDKYMRHFPLKAKDTDGQDKPMWRTRWSAPDPEWGDATHSPVLPSSARSASGPG
jgi:hypothetical protein